MSATLYTPWRPLPAAPTAEPTAVENVDAHRAFSEYVHRTIMDAAPWLMPLFHRSEAVCIAAPGAFRYGFVGQNGQFDVLVDVPQIARLLVLDPSQPAAAH